MSVPEARSPRSPANFCAQAADLVRVRSLSCTRNARARHFRQKNTYVLAQFPSDPLPGLLWPRCLPDASQMSPRCLPDASQIPLRCLSDASQMPPDASQMSPDASQKNCLGSRAGVILPLPPEGNTLLPEGSWISLPSRQNPSVYHCLGNKTGHNSSAPLVLTSIPHAI